MIKKEVIMKMNNMFKCPECGAPHNPPDKLTNPHGICKFCRGGTYGPNMEPNGVKLVPVDLSIKIKAGEKGNH